MQDKQELLEQVLQFTNRVEQTLQVFEVRSPYFPSGQMAVHLFVPSKKNEEHDKQSRAEVQVKQGVEHRAQVFVKA